MSEQEQRLAEYLKRAVPEPPVWLSPEEITVQHPERSRKSWAMPVLAAAAVVAIGVTIGAVATHHPTTRPPAASSVADQSSTGSTSTGSTSTGSSQPTPSCQGQGASVAVPNVVGMNIRQAEHVLTQAGFDSVTVVQPSTEPAGTVIKQSPAAGTQLRRGSLIEMTASETKALGPSGTALSPDCLASATPSAVPSSTGATVPNVVGMGQNQAIRVLQAAGFTVSVRYEALAGRSVLPEVVRSQTPPGGTQVPRATEITLDVPN